MLNTYRVLFLLSSASSSAAFLAGWFWLGGVLVLLMGLLFVVDLIETDSQPDPYD